jgi:hypothetical protein
VLRTTFIEVDGQPVQQIGEPDPVRLAATDLRPVDRLLREIEVRRLAAEEARRPFDLARGPLVRGALIRLDESERILLLTMHHAASDGWSLSIFTRELSAVYEALTTGRPPTLPELAIQYADYATWQRELLEGPYLQEQVEYWTRQLAGAPARLELPADRPRPPLQTLAGARYHFDLPGTLVPPAESVGRQEGTTLFMTLLAAFKVFLYAQTGQDDLLVGSPFANRTRGETEGLIGPFVNTLVLRTRLTGRLTFREVLGRVRAVVLGADAHQDLPFDQVVQAVRPPRDPSRNPLFQVNFRLVTSSLPPLSLPGVVATPLASEYGNSKFDAALELCVTAEKIQGYLEYSTDLFLEESAARMSRAFGRILQEVLDHPDVSLDDLESVSEVVATRFAERRPTEGCRSFPRNAAASKRKRRPISWDE